MLISSQPVLLCSFACMLECPSSSFTRLWCFSGPATVNCHKQSLMTEPLFLHRNAALTGLCHSDCLFWSGPETCRSVCSVGRWRAASWEPHCTVIQYLQVEELHRDTPSWRFVFSATQPLNFWQFSVKKTSTVAFLTKRMDTQMMLYNTVLSKKIRLFFMIYTYKACLTLVRTLQSAVSTEKNPTF